MKAQPDGDRHADILDPDVYVHGVPHAAFQRLRDDDPVSWWPEPDGPGLWAVTRYDDVVAVSRQSQVFSSAKGIRIEDMQPDELAARRTMMELDPPAHTTYRRLVQPPFSFREMASYEQALRLMARSVIAEARVHAAFDFVELLARQLPMRMLGTLLGVPPEDGPWLVRRGDALIGNADPEVTDTPVGLADTDAYRLLPFRSPVSLELFANAAGMLALRAHLVPVGNFDERRFPRPFAFDIRRTPNEHLAFGLKSPHKCLGVGRPAFAGSCPGQKSASQMTSRAFDNA